MERKFTKENLRGIYRLLTEIAKGNFSYEIIRSRYKDELEGLITYTNQTMQELNRSRKQFLWINRHNEVVRIRTANFQLDDRLNIQKLSFDTPKTETVNSTDLIGIPFQELLAKPSKKSWLKKIKSLEKPKNISFYILLEYKFDNLLNIHLDTIVSKFYDENKKEYIVTSFFLELTKDRDNLQKKTKLKTYTTWDQQLFHSIQVYIDQHLEEPLINIEDLALEFNTNTHKITQGFKEIFGYTPFQYHARKRIERSKLLIEYSDLSLKEISIKLGYGSYPDFSKRFKTITKLSPKQYRYMVRTDKK